MINRRKAQKLGTQSKEHGNYHCEVWLDRFSSNSHQTFYWSLEACWSKSRYAARSRNRVNGHRSQGCAALFVFHSYVDFYETRSLGVSAQRAQVPSPPPHAVEAISRQWVSVINQLMARALAPSGRSNPKNVSHWKKRSLKIQKCCTALTSVAIYSVPGSSCITRPWPGCF